MKIVVIGGTGLIGSKVVAQLAAQGHDVVPASPSLGINVDHRRGTCRGVRRRVGRGRRVELALVRVCRGPRVLRDLDAEHPSGGGGRRGRPPRRAVGRRHHGDVRARRPRDLDRGLLRGQARPGIAHPGVADPVHDRARHPVLRVHPGHRGRRRPTATSSACPRRASSRWRPTTSPRPSPGPPSAHRSTASSRSAGRSGCTSTRRSAASSPPGTTRAWWRPIRRRPTTASRSATTRSSRAREPAWARSGSTTGSANRPPRTRRPPRPPAR